MSLDELNRQLLTGIKLSQQSRYARRQPASSAVPYLDEARSQLRDFLEYDPNNIRAWELLSLAEESLLHFSAAIECIEKASCLRGMKRKEDHKRIAMLTQAKEEWEQLPLSPIQLADLGRYLVSVGADRDDGVRTFDGTLRWLIEHNVVNHDEVIQAFERRGAYSDFQLLHNLIRG